MDNFSPEDKYQLRRFEMIAEKKNLEAQRARQELERLILDLEHKYTLRENIKAMNDSAQLIKIENEQTHKENGKGSANLMGATTPISSLG
jgi:hypothetical protein